MMVPQIKQRWHYQRSICDLTNNYIAEVIEVTPNFVQMIIIQTLEGHNRPNSIGMKFMSLGLLGKGEEVNYWTYLNGQDAP